MTRIALLTREFPPYVYGGAGVHVDYLSRELRRLERPDGRPEVELEVHALGAPRPGARAYGENDPRLTNANAALRILSADLAMTAGVEGAQVVHSHTWYAGLAGHLAKLLYDIPHVLTAHSLEPLRPWKAEQLGGGYRLSCWAERTAYASADAVIAVSGAMRADILDCYPRLDPQRTHVIHNGIDTTEYRPDPETPVLRRIGVDPSRPYALFVGRITRQKGVRHLLAAAARLDPAVQLVLLAGSADTTELGREVAESVAGLRSRRTGVIWVEQMLPRPDVIQLLTHATVFVCPSIYEPQGIVNLEAMACETAVVASDVGGIPEVVVDGTTGLLVHYDDNDETSYQQGLAAAIDALVADPERAARMGRDGRRRAIEAFDWTAIARRTLAVYRSLVSA